MSGDLVAEQLVGGTASADVLHSDVGLSFWGGVDPESGTVIDHTHPLHKQCITKKILAIPNGRGSCTGSQVMLELILNHQAPTAILLRQPDVIICLGVIVAEELFGKSIPIISIGNDGFAIAATSTRASIDGCSVTFFTGCDDTRKKTLPIKNTSPFDSVSEKDYSLVLSKEEIAMLEGDHGKAKQVAMRILSRAAVIQRASHLMKITQAHIDGCTYIGPGGLEFAQKLVALGGHVSVPTSLNSISVDRKRWRSLGVSPKLGEPAYALSEAYVSLGAKPTFTCAPYLLTSAPAKGDQIAWGESNAVMFANSVLGARTQKYADYLDICAAIVGRVPAAGPHLDENRLPTVILDVEQLTKKLFEHCGNDQGNCFYPVLGYLCGLRAEACIPLIVGLLEGGAKMPSHDDLKAFSAAFGTSGSAPMFHIAGVTPEALHVSSQFKDIVVETCELSVQDFTSAWSTLNNSGAVDGDDEVDLIAIGNPHLSLAECSALARTCQEQQIQDNEKRPQVSIVVTMGRDVFAAAESAGYTAILKNFGVKILTDTCWCMITEPVVPKSSRTIMTNSGKYAHYGPGLVNRRFRFGSMRECVQAASTGRVPSIPSWVHSRTMSMNISTNRTTNYSYQVGTMAAVAPCNTRRTKHLVISSRTTFFSLQSISRRVLRTLKR